MTWNGKERRVRVSWKWRAQTVVWILFALAAGAGIRENRQLAHDGVVARDALCVFKLDLRTRVQAAEAFLEKNPEGFPGIPASAIRTSIANQRATLESLSGLRCR